MLARRAKQEKLAKANDIDWRRWSEGEYADEEGNVHQREVIASAPEAYPHDPAEAMKRAYAKAEALKRGVAEARRKEAAALDKMASTFNELTTYFRRPDSTPIPVVKEQAFLMHGGKGEQLIDQIVKVTPGLAKMSHHKAVIRNSLESVDGEAYGLVSQFLDELEDYKSVKQSHAVIKESADSVEAETLRPFDQGPRSVLDDEIFSQTSEKRASLLFGASAVKNLLGDVGKTIQAPEANYQTQQMYNQLTDPDHEAELRNIRSQAMLQDLMLNDPVISSYDPQDAMNAYNDIVSMSPRASGQRLLMQSLLRKQLEQGAMDPFEVDQLLGMEEKQKKINTMPTKGLGDESVIS
jgi:hypothetical protein